MNFKFFVLLLCIQIPLQAAVQDAITREVGVKTLVFRDDKQHRPLIAEVFYPRVSGDKEKTTTDIFNRTQEARDAPLLINKTKYPLIVVSHGQRGDRFSLAWLCSILADHGYIVASLDHFGATWSNNNPEEAIKRWHRAEDISLLITFMLKDPVFGPHIDEKKIGMIGYSLGSLTGLWLAGGIASKYEKPSLATGQKIELEEGLREEVIDSLDISEAKKDHLDKRIKSFILLAPVYSKAFDKSGLFRIKAPILLIAAENDQVALPKEAALFHEWIPTSSLIILGKKSEHGLFLNKPEEDSLSLTDRFELQKTIVKETLKFFDQTL